MKDNFAYCDHLFDETTYMVYFLIYENKIPMPSMIVDSGRGVHLYWRIENAPYGVIQIKYETTFCN